MGMIVTILLFGGLLALAAWCTSLLIGEHQDKHAQQQRAITRRLEYEQELDPRYQAKVESERRYNLESRRLALQERELAVSQYGTLVFNQQPTGYTFIQPVHKSVPMLPPAGGTTASTLSSAPPFASVKPHIKPGHLILGYSAQGPIIGDVSDLLSMAFVGKPKTGKSTALLYYLAMLLMIDADVYVFDHQGSLNEVSGLIPYYGEFSTLHDPVPEIYADIIEREDLWRNGRQIKKPLMVLMDELPAVARYEQMNKIGQGESLLQLAEKIVLENRKHNVYCLLTGQALPANVLPTLTRDNLSSRLVFNSSDMHARMAGLDKDTREKLLPMLRKAQPGTAILDVSSRPQPDIATLPYTTVDDLRAIVEGNTHGNGNAWERDNETPEAIPAVPQRNTGTLRNGVPLVSAQERERIIRVALSGVPRREICAHLGKGKWYYDTVKQVLDEEGL